MGTIKYMRLSRLGLSGLDMKETVDSLLDEAVRLLEWDMDSLTSKQKTALRQRLTDAVANFYFTFD